MIKNPPSSDIEHLGHILSYRNNFVGVYRLRFAALWARCSFCFGCWSGISLGNDLYMRAALTKPECNYCNHHSLQSFRQS